MSSGAQAGGAGIWRVHLGWERVSPFGAKQDHHAWQRDARDDGLSVLGAVQCCCGTRDQDGGRSLSECRDGPFSGQTASTVSPSACGSLSRIEQTTCTRERRRLLLALGQRLREPPVDA